MLALIARAAGAVPLLPEDAGFKTLEPVVNSCACCEGSLAAMLDYCRTQKPMGDLHMEHFSCDNIHSPGCGASEAKCDCEARMAQLRQDNCTLKCKVLESVPFACPSCVVPSPPPPPPPSPKALVSECRPVATPCCEAMLGQLQKFCFSFKPAGGWPRATKCDDPSHWDGGQMVPPAAFDPLLDDSVDFDTRIRRLGVPGELRIYRTLPHTFPSFPHLHILPEVADALDTICEWLDDFCWRGGRGLVGVTEE